MLFFTTQLSFDRLYTTGSETEEMIDLASTELAESKSALPDKKKSGAKLLLFLLFIFCQISPVSDVIPLCQPKVHVSISHCHTSYQTYFYSVSTPAILCQPRHTQLRLKCCMKQTQVSLLITKSLCSKPSLEPSRAEMQHGTSVSP